MSGYSGTPLPKKLGIKPGFRVWLAEIPADVRAELKAQLDQCEIVREAKVPLDFAMRSWRGNSPASAVGLHPQECCG